MEEILISLKHANYFEDSQIGVQFIEQFIQQVLSPFVKKQNDDMGEEELTLGQQPSILQYVVGTLRLLLLLQSNQESPQTLRLVNALSSFLKQIIQQLEESFDEENQEGEEHQEIIVNVIASGISTLLLLNKLEVAAEIAKGIMNARVRSLFINKYAEGEVDQDDTSGSMIAVYLTKLVP